MISIMNVGEHCGGQSVQIWSQTGNQGLAARVLLDRCICPLVLTRRSSSTVDANFGYKDDNFNGLTDITHLNTVDYFEDHN